MNFFFRWPWTFTNDLRTKSWNTLRSQAILVWSKNLQCFSIREISWNEKGFDNLKEPLCLTKYFQKKVRTCSIIVFTHVTTTYTSNNCKSTLTYTDFCAVEYQLTLSVNVNFTLTVYLGYVRLSPDVPLCVYMYIWLVSVWTSI